MTSGPQESERRLAAVLLGVAAGLALLYAYGAATFSPLRAGLEATLTWVRQLGFPLLLYLAALRLDRPHGAHALGLAAAFAVYTLDGGLSLLSAWWGAPSWVYPAVALLWPLGVFGGFGAAVVTAMRRRFMREPVDVVCTWGAALTAALLVFNQTALRLGGIAPVLSGDLSLVSLWSGRVLYVAAYLLLAWCCRRIWVEHGEPEFLFLALAFILPLLPSAATWAAAWISSMDWLLRLEPLLRGTAVAARVTQVLALVAALWPAPGSDPGGT